MKIERFEYNADKKQTSFLVSTDVVVPLIRHLRSEGFYAGSMSSKNGISEVDVSATPRQISEALKDFKPTPVAPPIHTA